MRTLFGRVLLAAIISSALAACGPSNDGGSDVTDLSSAMKVDAFRAKPSPVSKPEAVAEEAQADAAMPAPPPPPPGAPPVAGTPPGAPMLAYEYTYGLETPAARVQPLMKQHETECAKAGANVCQVLGSSTNSYGEQNIQGQLILRAAPAWLEAFRGRLDGDAKNAGGRVTAANMSSDDLTRAIVDTEARLRAARTLRDRLQTLLASRPGKLSDLLDVERELARVQGDIDSTESNLAVMKTRVATSRLTLSYTSAGAPLTDRTFEPIKDALTNFTRIVAEVVAFMIQLIAVVLPWALLLWLVVWLLGRWAKQRRAAKAAKAAVTAPT